MEMTKSTRELSRQLTKLLRKVAEEGAEITITSRGKPVAVLCPYERYHKLRRRGALERLMELAEEHLTGLTLEGTYHEAREELEAR